MFIGDPKRGIPERMNADQRELFHKVYEKIVQYGNDCYSRVLIEMVKIAFENHTLPVKCTCGEYPTVRCITINKNQDMFCIHCIDCGNPTSFYPALNEAVIAWNDSLQKELSNGKNL